MKGKLKTKVIIVLISIIAILVLYIILSGFAYINTLNTYKNHVR